jgi:hypothetical protein
MNCSHSQDTIATVISDYIIATMTLDVTVAVTSHSLGCPANVNARDVV